MENQEVIQLKLHYFLSDDNLHSMDAKVYNECERQFVQMILSLNKYFDTPLEIEVSSRNEGGVIGRYTVKIVKNPVFLLLLGAAVARFFDATLPEALSPTEETKNKLENIKTISELVKSNDLTPELFDYVTANGRVQLSILQLENIASGLKMQVIDIHTYPDIYRKAEAGKTHRILLEFDVTEEELDKVNFKEKIKNKYNL